MTIDTSKMSEGKRAALELAEAARESTWEHASFVRDLFLGRLRLPLVHPFPAESAADAAAARPFLDAFAAALRETIDPDEIDRTGEMPPEAIARLAAIGAFGIKIKKEYGGLGLSQTAYLRAAILVGSWCGNTTTLLSVHQSVGVPQPLILAGTEEQKRKFLPRVAKGELSAFALTEPSVGSDPAKMATTATPTGDGHYLINGEKLWCTNGTKAKVLIVVAKTPAKEVDGKKRDQITAFIVEADSPGLTVEHRCRFMGLHGISNGVLRFRDVRVPAENIVGGEGRGLKLALSTLNTGRLTIAGACVGLGKRCLGIIRKWSNERVQWGAPIGKHGAIADKIARMAARTFAMEAIALYAARLVDLGKRDVRLESAMAKMWCTETSWDIVDQSLQIRGGRGFETAESLQARGEEPIGIERMFRDSRVNLIFEGSSEIMRLLIAREALDPHLAAAGAALDSRAPFGKRFFAVLKAGWFYARWYPRLHMPFDHGGDLDRRLRPHVRRVSSLSRRLARTMFWQMVRYGAALEAEQVQLSRLVDIGTELFVMAATCSYAQHQSTVQPDAIGLADLFCRDAALKVERLFFGVRKNVDRSMRGTADRVLEGKLRWLEDGIVER